jgi:cob(I)alamin adenosyltransferase
MPTRKGYVQVYTGNAKGKTTAALGLALRAAGAGRKVFIAQFIKQRRCSEHRALERLGDLITVTLYGAGFVRSRPPGKAALALAKKGMEEVREVLRSGRFQVVILDEINVAVHYRMISVDELLDLIDRRPPEIELILTGRYAHEKVIEKADLVTEMKEIKHYYRNGVKARVGIEF